MNTPLFAHEQTEVAFSDLHTSFTLPSFSDTCGNTIEYQIMSGPADFRVPEGLTGEILESECGDGQIGTCLYILSEPW